MKRANIAHSKSGWVLRGRGRWKGLKESKLSSAQIREVGEAIKWCRDHGYYWLGDHLKYKLIEVGYQWRMAEIVDSSNLLGHMKDYLDFRVNKDGSIIITGFVDFPNKPHGELIYKEITNE